MVSISVGVLVLTHVSVVKYGYHYFFDCYIAIVVCRGRLGFVSGFQHKFKSMQLRNILEAHESGFFIRN